MAITVGYKARNVEIKTLRRPASPASWRQDSVNVQRTQAGVLQVTGTAIPATRQWAIEGVVTASGATELWNLWLEWDTDRANRVEDAELAIALTDQTLPFGQTAQVVFSGATGAPKLERFDDYGKRWTVKLAFDEIGGE